MTLRYHWGLGIGHTYLHSMEHDDTGGHPSQPGVQSNESRGAMNVNIQLKSDSNWSGSTPQVENNLTCVDDVVVDGAAKLTLVDREALDWKEGSDSDSGNLGQEDVDGDCVSEDEGNSMGIYDGLGSDLEWADMDD